MDILQTRGLNTAVPSWQRCLILTGILAVGILLLAWIEQSPATGVARWPDEAEVFAVENWSISQAPVERLHGTVLIRHTYHSGDSTAHMALTTSPEAKRIYRAGADVPFLGNGYTVDPAPPSLVAPRSDRGALLLRRETELGLLLFTYGESRGRLGNGIPAWAMVGLDALFGRRNDYYVVRIWVPLDRPDSPAVSAAVDMSETLFSSLAAWYAD